MEEIRCRLLVIGAGPGGYVCAIRAGQLSVDTVLVDKATPGGTCLNVGCIPSKALIHAAEEFHALREASSGHGTPGIATSGATLDLAAVMGWKDGIVGRLTGGVSGLLSKAGVKLVAGAARFLDGKRVVVETETGPRVIHAENVVIATGSEPVELPSLRFGDRVISSTGALALTELPDRLVVVGGGYIGLELGTAFVKLGSKVTVVEAAGQILPQYGAALVRPVAKRLAELGVRVFTGCKALGMTAEGLTIERSDGETEVLPAERVLVTVGRRPLLSGWGIEQIELDLVDRFIRIDETCRTSMRGIFAIGDVTGEPMLAHRAMAQGEMVAEIVAGHRRVWDKRCIPAICFTDPEIVTVGQSPDEAAVTGASVRVAEFPFAANGRSMTLRGEGGFVRIVARADNHLILGMQACGRGVSELATAFGLAVETGQRLEDVAGTIHAHPTLGEALQEAALRGLGHALHI
jgi:dihydrolipoamide dehydrogenase